MDGSIKVSVVMTTYNHERFIRQALESVLMQKTDFEYEVLVGDDASTDGTADIIREMEKKFHGRLCPILREKNVGMYENSDDLENRSRGEYVAYLEGDDFWTDPDKLQKQVSFLDAHPEYIACYHKNRLVDWENRVLEENMSYYAAVTGDYTVADFNRYLMPGQTATLMVRRSMLRFYVEHPLPALRFAPGDRVCVLTALAAGKIYCMDEVMSAYRTVVGSGLQSWTTRNGQENWHGHYHLFMTCRELEQVGKVYGLPVCLRDRRQGEMMALMRAMRGKKLHYFPLLCFMVLKDGDLKGFHEQVWKPFWQETREIVRQKRHQE